jgi:uncharacterized protein (DUF983 family)
MGLQLRRAARLRCPACGKGKPFQGLKMRHHCEVCGFRFEREPGYFMGSIYFNYGATAGIEIVGYFALEWLFGLGLGTQIPIWLTFAAAFPVWFHRYARSLWMAIDLSVSPPVTSDFVRV